MYAKTCHVFSQFLSNKLHEVFNVFRFSAEAFAKLRILCCHTYRTGIQVADTHHDTAHGYKRCCRKAKFLRTKKCCDRNVTAAHQLTICLNTDTVTQSVHDQGLMCLCKTKLPRKSRIVDGTSRSCTGTTVIA